MDKIQFACIECEAVLDAESRLIGSTLTCPCCQAENKVPPYGVTAGMKIGDFIVEKRLGIGGMGEVWLADQPGMQRMVALKILSPELASNPEFTERFMHEARLAGKLIHPNIVTAHHAGEDNQIHYLAISYVDGVELDELLKQEGSINENQALGIVIDIARALKYAWDKFRILHRDIKPSNIMVAKDGTSLLMDLGISKSLAEDVSMTMTGVMVGTPAFVSPEQAKSDKDIDTRSDQYSLGTTLYYMVTGRLPFVADTAMAIVSKHLTEELPDCRGVNPLISEACKQLIERMMKKDKEERFSAWDEFISAAQEIVARNRGEIEFCCSKCRTPVSVDAQFVNQMVTCPTCGTDLKVPHFGIVPGMKIGDFVAEKRLGMGGMGEVWLADQPDMQRKVALKILSPELSENVDFTQRFMREARMAGKLIHPHIITAYHAGVDKGIRYLAISYVEGCVLGDLMKTERKMDEKKALRIIRETAEALKYAWDKFSMLHRDVKPDNIMIDKDGTAMLMDMGISKITTDDVCLTATGTVVGTPAYISPEQATSDKDIDFRADLYSLGATLYHMVTGVLPYEGSTTMEIVSKHLTAPLPDCQEVNPAISDGTKALIDKMMVKDRDCRHASWQDFIADVDKVLSGETPSRVKKRTNPMLLVVGAAAVVAVLLGIVVIVVLNRPKQPKPEPFVIPGEDSPPPEQVRPAQPSPAPPAPPEDKRRQKQMAADWSAAVEFAAAHPQDYSACLAKYQELADRYQDPEYRTKAEKEIAKLKEAETKARSSFLATLEKKAVTAATSHDYDRALEILAAKGSPWAATTATSRKKLIEKYQSLKKDYEASLTKQPEPPVAVAPPKPEPKPKPIPKKTDPKQQLLEKVANAFLKGKPQLAQEAYDNSPVKHSAPELGKTLDCLDNIYDIIRQQLEKEVGKEFETMEDGKMVSYPIKKVSDNYIHLAVKMGRALTVKKIPIKKLPFDARISYLEKAGADPAAIAVLQTNHYFRKGDIDQSLKTAAKARYLSKYLTAAIQTTSANNDRRHAQASLQRILARMGFDARTDKQETILKNLKTLKLDSTQAKALLADIAKLKGDPSAADFVFVNQDFIDQITATLQKLAESKEDKLFKDLQKRLGTTDEVTRQLVPVMLYFHTELDKAIAKGISPLYLGASIEPRIRYILPPDKAPLMGKYLQEEFAKRGYTLPAPRRR